MKTFESITYTHYFKVLVRDMVRVLANNEVIFENINARNFFEVFTRFYQDSAIYNEFKEYRATAKTSLPEMLRIFSDAGEAVEAVERMNPTDLKTLSLFDLDYIIRSTLFGEVLMYALEENMEK